MSDEHENGQSTESLTVGDVEKIDSNKVQEFLAEPAISDVKWAAAVRRFVDEHVRNSPVAAATEAWNHLHSVLPRLRECLEAELSHKE